MTAVLTVDFIAFNKYVLPVASQGYPVMIRGSHGIGKSEVVYQTKDKFGWNEETQEIEYMTDENRNKLTPYIMVERRVSQMTEGDLLGIPDPKGFKINNETASKFRPFSWLVEACTQPSILFLDELDRGISEVRQGFFELADSRKIAGWELHPGTMIFAAINGGGEGGHRYQVNELDLAEADRWATFDLRPTVEDWINYGKESGKIHNLILDFISANHDHLEYNGDTEPGKKYPSRRSWTRLSKCFEKQGCLEKDTLDVRAIRFIGDSFVGIEAAGEFADFVEKYEFQVSPADIMDHGKVELTKGWQIGEYMGLADKIIRADYFKKELTENQMDNIVKWFVMLPSEVAMTVFNAIGAEEQKNIIEFHSRVVDGVAISDIICEIITGTTSKE